MPVSEGTPVTIEHHEPFDACESYSLRCYDVRADIGSVSGGVLESVHDADGSISYTIGDDVQQRGAQRPVVTLNTGRIYSRSDVLKHSPIGGVY